VSDGLNSQMDRKTFKALGDAAARARVPIHTIAFSPTDERGPLLNLGEISKRSNGTFRWAKTAEDLRAQIDTLTDELNKQYVLTFKLETRSLEGKKFQLAVDELTSNILVFDPSGGSFGGGGEGKRPLVPWWLWLLAGLVLVGGGGAVVVAKIVAARPKKPMKFSPYRAGAPAAQAAQPSAPPAVAPVSQPMAPVAVAGRVETAAPARGVLVVVSGALAGSRFDVGAQPLSVGKGPSSLQIGDDPAVSTRHAELAQRGTLFVVTDSGLDERHLRQQPAHRAADPPERRRSLALRQHANEIQDRIMPGSSIIVCGKKYDIGQRVVTFEDDPGVNAYTPHRTDKPSEVPPFQPAKGMAGIRDRWRQRRLIGADRSIDRLKQVVRQFVVHHDGCQDSRTCFQVLHNERGLSVHFLIDNDGTVFQTLDLVDCAFQAAGVNEISVGVELANRGDAMRFPERLSRQARQGDLQDQRPPVARLRLHQSADGQHDLRRQDAGAHLSQLAAELSDQRRRSDVGLADRRRA
jgi:hypothetical protein